MARCKVCKKYHTPSMPLQSVCGWECAAIKAAKDREKKEKKRALQQRLETKAKLATLKPLSHWEKLAQRAVNRYVRARDVNDGCISCDKPADWNGQWHASHFRSVGASSAVRYNTYNIHKACWICNKLYSGRIGDYTPSLIAKIGQERVDWLRAQTHTVKFTREYLQRMARIFNKRAKTVEKRMGLH